MLRYARSPLASSPDRSTKSVVHLPLTGANMVTTTSDCRWEILLRINKLTLERLANSRARADKEIPCRGALTDVPAKVVLKLFLNTENQSTIKNLDGKEKLQGHFGRRPLMSHDMSSTLHVRAWVGQPLYTRAYLACVCLFSYVI